MLNNIYPLTIQAAVTAPGVTPVAAPYQAAATWIGNEVRLLVLGY